jgi:succinyl-CoA synthetase beta subunit
MRQNNDRIQTKSHKPVSLYFMRVKTFVHFLYIYVTADRSLQFSWPYHTRPHSGRKIVTMNIHEHQAKKILQTFGAPIAAGVAITSLDQAEGAIASLPGPVWVVKSQIHAGGRGKGKFKELGADAKGGVRVSFSAEEALANAVEMFGKTLVTQQTGPNGKAVNQLYVEDGADIDRELYLSILVDRETGKTSFVASTEGGMDIETVAHDTPELIHSVGINASTGCTDADAATLADAFKLEGSAREQGKALFKNLYEAFVSKDMSLLEINPLIVTKSNDVQVLDAKVSFDNNALFRHPDVMELRDVTEEDEKEVEASKHDLAYIALDGEIGCMVNGAGLAMATMDIIKLYGAEPANFLDVGGSATTERVTAAFKIITADPNVKGILVNIFGGIMRCDVIAEGVVQAAKDINLEVPLVVRLEGTKVDEGKAIINNSGLNVIAADDLDDAAQKIVKAVKG